MLAEDKFHIIAGLPSGRIAVGVNVPALTIEEATDLRDKLSTVIESVSKVVEIHLPRKKS